MTAVEVVEAVYGHLERREGAELLDLFADDIVLRVPDVLPFGGSFEGRQAAAAALASIWEHVFDWGAQLDEVRSFEDRVVSVGRHPVATTEGVTIDVPFLAVWRVEDGRVVRFEEHLDTLQFLRAVGRSARG